MDEFLCEQVVGQEVHTHTHMYVRTWTKLVKLLQLLTYV